MRRHWQISYTIGDLEYCKYIILFEIENIGGLRVEVRGMDKLSNHGKG